MIKEVLTELATDSRYKCSECNRKIHKGERLYRSIMRGYRNSHTCNICQFCILKIFLELNKSEVSLNNEKAKEEYELADKKVLQELSYYDR